VEGEPTREGAPTPGPRPFRFGVSVGPATSRAAWRTQARRAEALGFDTLLLADHLDDPSPLLVVAAASTDATERLRVGTFVLNNDFHHPVLLAREAATLGLLTDGRFELGIGAGHMQSEYDQAGIGFDPAAVRVARLAESVHVLRGLLAGEEVTFHGAHYRVTGHRAAPLPPSPVPLLVGGNGRRLLAVAAEYADIVGFTGFSPDASGAGVRLSHFGPAGLADRIAQVRRRAGHRFGSLELNVLIQRVIVTDDRRAAVERVQSRLPSMSAAEVLDSPFLLIGTHDQMAEALRERRDRFGVSYWVVFAERPDSDQTLDTLGPVIERLS
jgi:probable F420-dependent oxidoreductase